MQGRNKDIDVETGHAENSTVGDGEGGMDWETRTDTHTGPCMKQKASGKVLYITGSSAQCSKLI